MDFRLIQRDHPLSIVNDYGITHRDPYVRTCWGPRLGQQNAEFLATVRELTADGDRVIGLGDLSRVLRLQGLAPHDRLAVITEATLAGERAGLGHRIWAGSDRQAFCLYRAVPLLDEPRLRTLGDAELSAHADALAEVNQRLQIAGRPPVQLPDWAADRLSRTGHAVEPPPRPGDPTPTTRLDALQRPRPPESPGPSQ